MHLRKGFYLRCDSRRVTQCNRVIVYDVELHLYKLLFFILLCLLFLFINHFNFFYLIYLGLLNIKIKI